MPLLGLGKEGLDPDLPFAHGLLVDIRDVVATHCVEVVGVEGTVDDATVVAGRAFRFDEARVADRSVGAVGSHDAGSKTIDSGVFGKQWMKT